jgi:hypothetical protein
LARDNYEAAYRYGGLEAVERIIAAVENNKYQASPFGRFRLLQGLDCR